MDNSLIDDEDRYIENDSLSSQSFSRDSLKNGCHIEPHQEILQNNNRRKSYTLEASVEVSGRHVPTNSHRNTFLAHKSSSANTPRRQDMTQSLYERPWVTTGRNNSLSQANAKQREEKLRQAKEKQERKQKQKRAELNENEKIAQRARIRKEAELQKKLEEMKQKVIERQRIVDARKERLNEAEEMRRKTILRKLVGKKVSPQSSNNIMIMSCYGGFGGANSRPGNKEVVHDRFHNNRPPLTTGKIIAFGSSTPRPICANTAKANSEKKKIPEAILVKCELLSRPLSLRISNNMTNSVIVAETSRSEYKEPQRQSSLKERNTSKGTHRSLAMTTSMFDFPSKNQLKSYSAIKQGSKSDLPIKNEATSSISQTRKHPDFKHQQISNARTTSASSNSNKRSEVNTVPKSTVKSKSGAFLKNISKTKIDMHLDSDSIDEEVSTASKQSQLPTSVISKRTLKSQICTLGEKDQNVVKKDSETDNNLSSQSISGRVVSSKDVSETEYKARLLENRRLSREKREREREQLIKTERDKRHAEEIAAREIIEAEREKDTYLDDSCFTTSKDDALDGLIESQENNEYVQLSRIAESQTTTSCEPRRLSNINEEEKNERRKKIDSIMSRLRKINDESSSDGGASPRRAMSPEPAELELDINVMVSMPAFRSSLLQSMMNNGRLSKGLNMNTTEEINTNTIQLSTVSVLSSVRESLEDNESQLTNMNSPSSAAIRSSGLDGNSLSDANSEFAPEPILEIVNGENQPKDFMIHSNVPNIDREDCDGKEDSLSLNDARVVSEPQTMDKLGISNVDVNIFSESSSETEEEEIIKNSLEIDSSFGPGGIHSVTQERGVFQN